MIRTMVYCAFALCACLVFTLPAWGADDAGAGPPSGESPAPAPPSEEPPTTVRSTTDIEAEAKALMAAGRFDEALAVLRPVVQAESVTADVLFLYGLAALEASQRPEVSRDERDRLLRQAVAAFYVMLVERPGLVRVRLELARAFFLKGDDELARRHFEHVLAGDPPPAVAANVKRFLAEMRARAHSRWRFNLGFALAPDSNLSADSGERTVYLYGLPFRRDAQDLITSGVGVSLWGGAEYQLPLNDAFRLRAGANASRLEYEESEFDELFLTAHLGPRWLVNRDLEMSLLASVGQRWLGTAPYHRQFGARFEAGRRLTRSMNLFGQASWHERRYRTRLHLDGPVFDSALRGTWVVSPTVRADLSVGWGRVRPEKRSERNRSRWLGAGVTVLLPLGFTLGAGGEYRWVQYAWGRSPLVPDNGTRKDRISTLRASVHHRAFTVFGFSPQLVAVREKRTSNAQLGDYDRTRGELRFVRQF